MYRKKFLPKLVVASILVGGVNFVPATVNFPANLQIISVAYAANYTAKDTAMFDFGEDNPQIVEMVKNAARMRAVQKAKEQAGLYLKSQTKTVNSVVTADDILAITSSAEVLSVTYKKMPYQAHDVRGNDTGKIGFMYEATATVKIDDNELAKYVRRNEQERNNLIQQSKSSQENITKISNDFENFNKTAGNKTQAQVNSEVQKINNELLAQQKLDEGNELYYQQNYQGAISKYTEAIKLNPNYASAYYGRGVSYFDGLDDYNRGLTDLTKSIEIDQNFTQAYYARAILYGDGLHLYKQAIQDLTKFIQLNSTYALAYFARGCFYEEIQNYSQAIEDFTKVIKLKPSDYWFYISRGTVYYKIKNYDAAIKDYSKSIELYPNNLHAYKDRGDCYKALGKNAQAESDFAKARELGWKG